MKDFPGLPCVRPRPNRLNAIANRGEQKYWLSGPGHGIVKDSAGPNPDPVPAGPIPDLDF